MSDSTRAQDIHYTINNMYSGIGRDTDPSLTRQNNYARDAADWYGVPDTPTPQLVDELAEEVRRNLQLQQDYNSPEARAQRLSEFRERHPEATRYAARARNTTTNTTTTPIAIGILVAEVSWTQKWADDQPHITIPDSAASNHADLKLTNERTPAFGTTIVEGTRIDQPRRFGSHPYAGFAVG